ncbi:hypothetical protein [Pseudomonas sp. KK4]|uniref:hypothetical protein n=1 Tax=Pseudomonas sp. KK4 TaxID=1855729 RepID=UPI0011159DEB|nr:hypothetical protein [Pseudomonas sp. KK4]
MTDFPAIDWSLDDLPVTVSVTGPALSCGKCESKIPTSVQKRGPESPGLQGLQRTINSVDY